MSSEPRDRHNCVGCGRRFAVVYYQFDPDEPSRTVPVRCPHCDSVNRVPVGSAAALASGYRAERIGS